MTENRVTSIRAFNRMQDLALRTTLGGGYGRYLIRMSVTEFSWRGGLVYANEQFSTPLNQQSNENLELVLGLRYDLFRFDFGEAHSQFPVFPGLTDSGRVRMSTNNALTIKLRNRFHLQFNLWDNYDSRAPQRKLNSESVPASAGPFDGI